MPNLLQRNEDMIYKIVAKCFHYVAGKQVFKTSDFLSSDNFKVLKKSLIRISSDYASSTKEW